MKDDQNEEPSAVSPLDHGATQGDERAVSAEAFTATASDSDDRVGYKRPPRHSRFQPGRSGNPRGRSRGSRSLGAVLKHVMNHKISITENGTTRRVSTLEGMMHRLRGAALRGAKGAFKILLMMVERYAESGEELARLSDLLPEDLEILAQYEKEAL